MNTKKRNKFAIGFWIAISLTVAMAVALVAVLAATQRTALSSFKIQYTAGEFVEASIVAQYKVTNIKEPADIDYTAITPYDGLKFDGYDGNDSPKSFDPINNIKLDGENNCVIFEYYITNDSATHPLNVTLSFGSDTQNTNIRFGFIEDISYYSESDVFNNPLDTHFLMNEGVLLEPTDSTLIYIVAYVADPSSAGSFDGAFNFLLERVSVE